MAKYSYEIKKKIVDAYLRGEGGYNYLSSIYGPDSKDIRTFSRITCEKSRSLKIHVK